MSRALLGAAGLLALVLALILASMTGERRFPPGSTRSAEPEGRLAAVLLLEELALPARRFEAPPRALPAGPAVLWMPGAPALPHHLLGAPDETDGPALDDPRHALHYRRFVERGGTLVLPAGEPQRAFLERVFELEDVPLALDLAQQPDSVHFPGGQPLPFEPLARLAQGGQALHVPLPARGPEALVVDGEGRVVVLRQAMGAGSLVLLADDGFLSNARLGAARHAELFVRLVGELTARGEPLLFDEFALGSWAPAGKLELALAPGARGLTLHLLLLALVGAWIAGWPREFPRDAPAHEHRSPLERARAQAGLLARAGQWSHLALRLREGLLRRLAQRLRLAVREVERAEERDAALAALAAVPHAPPAAALHELFVTRPVKDARGLERLGADLAHLERELCAERDGARAFPPADPRASMARPSSPD